ncbi:tetratricopeptide repeat protein [Roseibium marinum]|uniref:Tetratricopeptide repeat protein n=1 Tax=Roseibium marinum TaxID=281252 RepID=A0A2S3ULY2_9HYPH|nr:tetratricopeptide repeat protein [Roseibium marinum]POF28705.1 tetratricopeptide repeat protein [Roseibium marinum]
MIVAKLRSGITQTLCVLAVVLVCMPGQAAPSGAQSEQDALFEALKTAPNEAEARKIEDDIWYSWLDAAPTPEIRSRIDTAMQRRGVYDFQGARDLLDEVVAEAPDYSEGWNQRAFILFLQGDYEASLIDIERALKLEPRHFGALSGKAMIFMTMGRVKLGQEALRKAVEIHPFLKERTMLLPEETEL